RVRAHALAIGDELVERGVKALVIACNTASAAMLRDARERYPVPVVEVIQPAARRAVATTRSGRIGVIATRATVASRAYDDALAAAPGVELTSVACPKFVEFVERGITSGRQVLGVAEAYLGPIRHSDGDGSVLGCTHYPPLSGGVQVAVTSVACPKFVEFVERGVTSGRQVLGLAEAYLGPIRHSDVDTLVLGCTHYPLLSGVIQLAVGDHVTLVSSAEETAKDVLRVLTAQDLLRPHDPEVPATREFLVTGDPDAFRRVASRFLGPGLVEVGRTPVVADRA